ncbi:cupin domain-containing protein [Gryllotalpicola sp.]|uniref:cupin domain-containing protein n=1 Tax=Gryllotalpicola sp. TaxID=1932787 RepID=UPI002630EBEA|nr:cupin domain-containing protein [Gryllotalpicola sp.]
MDNTNGKLSEEGLQEFMQELNRMHNRDDQHVIEPNLVTHSEDAYWLKGTTDNPSHLGLLRHLPMKTVEFILQMIPADTATDLQRHVHESIHYVADGSGWSEIGDQIVKWKTGDFVFTPPWIWHRHYADSQDVHMIIIENSRMLNSLDADLRESRGSISFADAFGAQEDR